ncbi:MAG: ABC transporter ATP-binding protein [Muricomes sp.]
MGRDKADWKVQWYESFNELVSVSGVNFDGKGLENTEMDNPLIQAEEVNLSYNVVNGNVQALENVSFNIYRGEFICVLGPSGCGKSTLLKILAGFIPPSSGDILLEGKKIKGIDWNRGVVFQNPPLYEWLSVRNNISFGPKMRKIPKRDYREETNKFLEKMGLEEFADKKIYELSGGMKQRVSIARALINNPEILLMDEPFGALDAFTRENMQTLIRKIWWESGKTIFFITHDVEEALLLGSRILVLSRNPGRVIDDVAVRFSRQIVEESAKNVQFTEDFYKYREKLLKLIYEQN